MAGHRSSGAERVSDADGPYFESDLSEPGIGTVVRSQLVHVIDYILVVCIETQNRDDADPYTWSRCSIIVMHTRSPISGDE